MHILMDVINLCICMFLVCMVRGGGKGVVPEEGGSSKRGRGAVEAIALIV